MHCSQVDAATEHQNLPYAPPAHMPGPVWAHTSLVTSDRRIQTRDMYSSPNQRCHALAVLKRVGEVGGIHILLFPFYRNYIPFIRHMSWSTRIQFGAATRLPECMVRGASAPGTPAFVQR